MRKIKIFRLTDFSAVEPTVNQWLAEHERITIVSMCQSESHATWHPWSLTITIFYYEGE